MGSFIFAELHKFGALLLYEVLDGQTVFDYKLHEGPCPTTNALKIMQLAGLPVQS